MAFYSGETYDLGFDPNLDTSWLDDYSDYDYGYVPEIPDLQLSQMWQPDDEYYPDLEQGQYVAPPEPAYIPPGLPENYQVQEFTDPGSYVPPAQQQVNPVTGAIVGMGKGVADWATQNPKDVIGAALGAGMGLYGLTQREGKVPRPDMSELAAARAALQAQAGKTARTNDPVYEAAMRNMQRELDQPGGHDPRLAEERKQLRAQREAYYQTRGLLGSDIANRELADFDRQTTSLLEDDAARRSQMRMGTYNVAAGAANPEQTSRTFSQLANLGVQGAQMEQAGATTNAQLQESRRNQLLSTGGNIFGRSIATDPMDKYIDPRTGKPRTGF